MNTQQNQAQKTAAAARAASRLTLDGSEAAVKALGRGFASECAELGYRLGTLEAQHAGAIAAKDAELASLQEVIEQMRHENEDHAAAARQISAKIAAAYDDAVIMRENFSASRAELAELKEANAEILAANEVLGTRNHELTAEVASLVKANGDLVNGNSALSKMNR